MNKLAQRSMHYRKYIKQAYVPLRKKGPAPQAPVRQAPVRQAPVRQASPPLDNLNTREFLNPQTYKDIAKAMGFDSFAHNFAIDKLMKDSGFTDMMGLAYNASK